MAAANQNDTKKIEELFAPNIRGKEFQKEVDDFLEFYNKTAKDGTWDKDDILLGVRESQDRHLYRVMHSSIELKKIIRIITFIWKLLQRIRKIQKIKESRLLI